MPRKARIDAPGAVHHIIVKGIDRCAIFRDAADTDIFLERLGMLISESSTACYAWALMRNHVHLLLRTGFVPISLVMRRLLTSYAQGFNGRHGVLFQNRYKSVLCEEDTYLLELVRYIHLNPVRARVIGGMEELNTYPLCGHSALMGKVVRPWQDTAYVLSLFGDMVKAARKGYEDFVSKGLSMGRRPELVGGGLIRSAGGWSIVKSLRGAGMRIMGDERILGSGDFVESVLGQAREQYEQRTQTRLKGPDLNSLITRVAEELGLESTRVPGRCKRRELVRARALICALAVDRQQISGREVSRGLKLTPAAVSKLAQRGRSDQLITKLARSLFEGTL